VLHETSVSVKTEEKRNPEAAKILKIRRWPFPAKKMAGLATGHELLNPLLPLRH